MMRVAEREIDIHFDPFPPFGCDLLCFGLQLLGDQRIEQADILQPSAIVLLKEIAHDGSAGLLVNIDADEQSAPVRCAYGPLSQNAADLIRLLAVRALQ